MTEQPAYDAARVILDLAFARDEIRDLKGRITELEDERDLLRQFVQRYMERWGWCDPWNISQFDLLEEARELCTQHGA